MRPIVALLVLTLALPSAPLFAAGADPGTSATRPIQAAVSRAADQAALTPSNVIGHDPLPRPQGGRRVYKRQNSGSNVGMVIGIVGALAGAAGTYYMIKQMKKSTDKTAVTAGFAR